MSNKVKIDYVAMWSECRVCTIKTMVSNLNADMQVGYNWLGECVQMQLHKITAYTLEYHEQMQALSKMTSEEAQKWCKKDMLKRGDME